MTQVALYATEARIALARRHISVRYLFRDALKYGEKSKSGQASIEDCTTPMDKRLQPRLGLGPGTLWHCPLQCGVTAIGKLVRRCDPCRSNKAPLERTAAQARLKGRLVSVHYLHVLSILTSDKKIVSYSHSSRENHQLGCAYLSVFTSRLASCFSCTINIVSEG